MESNVIIQAITIICTQVPVIGALIWFIVTHTKETNRRFAEQAKQFEGIVNNIVTNLGGKIDKIDDKLDELKLQIVKKHD
jgi:flagellar basal body-associated protein FliL